MSLYKILKRGIVVAFDAGNLGAVATDLERRYPKSQIVIMADNDLNSEYNTGLEKAREAANVVEKGIVLYPVWIDKEKNLIKQSVDWNDIYQEYRDKLDLMRKKIELALKTNMECVKFYSYTEEIRFANILKNIQKEIKYDR